MKKITLLLIFSLFAASEALSQNCKSISLKKDYIKFKPKISARPFYTRCTGGNSEGGCGSTRKVYPDYLQVYTDKESFNQAQSGFNIYETLFIKSRYNFQSKKRFFLPNYHRRYSISGAVSGLSWENTAFGYKKMPVSNRLSTKYKSIFSPNGDKYAEEFNRTLDTVFYSHTTGSIDNKHIEGNCQFYFNNESLQAKEQWFEIPRSTKFNIKSVESPIIDGELRDMLIQVNIKQPNAYNVSHIMCPKHSYIDNTIDIDGCSITGPDYFPPKIENSRSCAKKFTTKISAGLIANGDVCLNFKVIDFDKVYNEGMTHNSSQSAIVQDLDSGLIWSVLESPESQNYKDSEKFCKNKVYQGRHFRLPTLREIEKLRSKGHPISLDSFSYLWTSTKSSPNTRYTILWGEGRIIEKNNSSTDPHALCVL